MNMRHRFLCVVLALALAGAGCAGYLPTASPAAPSGGVVLDLSNQGLTKVPSEIFNRTGLEELDLSDNNLKDSLPSELGRLTNLKVLDISGNQMTGLPAEVGRLSKLEVLDISDNRLTGLPLELGNLTQLKVLDVSGNPYSTQDLDAIAEKLKNTEIRR